MYSTINSHTHTPYTHSNLPWGSPLVLLKFLMGMAWNVSSEILWECSIRKIIKQHLSSIDVLQISQTSALIWAKWAYSHFGWCKYGLYGLWKLLRWVMTGTESWRQLRREWEYWCCGAKRPPTSCHLFLSSVFVRLGATYWGFTHHAHTHLKHHKIELLEQQSDKLAGGIHRSVITL